MAKKHPGKQFMLGAMLGSTIGAVSAMMFTTKKGHSIQKNAMHKLHEFENYVKGLIHKNKGHVKRLVTHGKRKVAKTIKKLHSTAKRKKTRRS